MVDVYMSEVKIAQFCLLQFTFEQPLCLFDEMYQGFPNSTPYRKIANFSRYVYVSPFEITEI